MKTNDRLFNAVVGIVVIAVLADRISKLPITIAARLLVKACDVVAETKRYWKALELKVIEHHDGDQGD